MKREPRDCGKRAVILRKESRETAETELKDCEKRAERLRKESRETVKREPRDCGKRAERLLRKESRGTAISLGRKRSTLKVGRPEQ